MNDKTFKVIFCQSRTTVEFKDRTVHVVIDPTGRLSMSSYNATIIDIEMTLSIHKILQGAK